MNDESGFWVVAVGCVAAVIALSRSNIRSLKKKRERILERKDEMEKE